jgi:hypothetical protein
MRDFGVIFKSVTLIFDNTSAISVAKNPIFHKRMRHLEKRNHLLRDHVEKGVSHPKISISECEIFFQKKLKISKGFHLFSVKIILFEFTFHLK